jgi:hypothetical protein
MVEEFENKINNFETENANEYKRKVPVKIKKK